MRDSFARWRDDVFRPPGTLSRSQIHWRLRAPTWRRYVVGLLVAVLEFAFGFYFGLPEPIVMGFAMLLLVMAEHLPEEHTTLAGMFRLGGSFVHYGAFFVMVAHDFT